METTKTSIPRTSSPWAKKSLEKLMAGDIDVKVPGSMDPIDTGGGLRRTLTSTNLIALGIGAIIGAGLFVRTAAAAGGHAGPAVTISFAIAAFACALAGLCYAEFASMIPIAGSAYTYSYTTMGEFIAWIIGWDLVLEYALGAATVAIGWSQYLNSLLYDFFNFRIPYEWCHSPFQVSDGLGIYAGQEGRSRVLSTCPPCLFCSY